jgi:hypothetical protein
LFGERVFRLVLPLEIYGVVGYEDEVGSLVGRYFEESVSLLSIGFIIY